MICLYDPHSQLSTYLKCGPAAIYTAAFQDSAASQRPMEHLELSGPLLQIRKLRPRKEEGYASVRGRMGMRAGRVWRLRFLAL